MSSEYLLVFNHSMFSIQIFNSNGWVPTLNELGKQSVYCMPSSSNIKGRALPFAGNSMGYYKLSMVSVLKLFLMYTYFNFTIEKLGKMNVGGIINWFNLRNFQPFIINDKLFEVL